MLFHEWFIRPLSNLNEITKLQGYIHMNCSTEKRCHFVATSIECKPLLHMNSHIFRLHFGPLPHLRLQLNWSNPLETSPRNPPLPPLLRGQWSKIVVMLLYKWYMCLVCLKFCHCNHSYLSVPFWMKHKNQCFSYHFCRVITSLPNCMQDWCDYYSWILFPRRLSNQYIRIFFFFGKLRLWAIFCHLQ